MSSTISVSNGLLKDAPQHVAIIMDGNGRWAKSRGLPRIEGHRAGMKTVREIVEEARALGVRYLTLFAFSTENWQRPENEVSLLMSLFVQYLESELEVLLKNGVRLRAIGDLSRLPPTVRKMLDSNIERTKDQKELSLVLAVSYGGRDEILRAAKKSIVAAINDRLDYNNLTEEAFAKFLDAPDIPDPDLLIRTSDEFRISNFMLWQLAYSELIVTELCWPEFSREEFRRCLTEFSQRTRRFGKTDEQMANA